MMIWGREDAWLLLKGVELAETHHIHEMRKYGVFVGFRVSDMPSNGGY
jgi:hypothetical protein